MGLPTFQRIQTSGQGRLLSTEGKGRKDSGFWEINLSILPASSSLCDLGKVTLCLSSVIFKAGVMIPTLSDVVWFGCGSLVQVSTSHAILGGYSQVPLPFSYYR